MTYAEINKKRVVPWWAVLGAPMVGVPLVVAVLALVAPERQASGESHTVDFPVEQVDIDSVALPLDAEAVMLGQLLANS